MSEGQRWAIFFKVEEGSPADVVHVVVELELKNDTKVSGVR